MNPLNPLEDDYYIASEGTWIDDFMQLNGWYHPIERVLASCFIFASSFLVDDLGTFWMLFIVPILIYLLIAIAILGDRIAKHIENRNNYNKEWKTLKNRLTDKKENMKDLKSILGMPTIMIYFASIVILIFSLQRMIS